MLVIGLTGGIGSGKTAASDYLSGKGITVVDADRVARQVVEPDTPALKAIEQHFGNNVIQADGTLDRAALREIIFAKPEQRHWLEALLHPAIGEEILRQLRQSTSPYTLLVSPLLLETAQHTMADRILLIDAPPDLQMTRTTARDNVAASQVEAIIATQMKREEKRQKAHDVVLNDGSLENLHAQLDTLHHRYLQMAAEEKS